MNRRWIHSLHVHVLVVLHVSMSRGYIYLLFVLYMTFRGKNRIVLYVMFNVSVYRHAFHWMRQIWHQIIPNILACICLSLSTVSKYIYRRTGPLHHMIHISIVLDAAGVVANLCDMRWFSIVLGLHFEWFTGLEFEPLEKWIEIVHVLSIWLFFLSFCPHCAMWMGQTLLFVSKSCCACHVGFNSFVSCAIPCKGMVQSVCDVCFI